MHYSDYLREQAAKYRQLAEAAEDAFVKQEFLELAAVCEEVANEIDDRRAVDNRNNGNSVHLLAERHPPRRPFNQYRELEFHLQAPALITFPIWIGNSQDGLNAAMDVL